jgi:predicted HicB family RNase H-like nuclease
MDSKLTLKLNDSVIAKAKQYAKEHNISLSRMIENYLTSIT